MRVNTQNYNDVTVMELQGEVDADVSDALKDTVTSTVAGHRTRIVLDLANVAFIDSQGLELLLWVRQYCRQNKAQLSLAGLDENIEKILEVTGLQSEFDCHSELATAVRSFA
jgi:anti-anti-sigma factor